MVIMANWLPGPPILAFNSGSESISFFDSLPLKAANTLATRAPMRPPIVKSISNDPSLFFKKKNSTINTRDKKMNVAVKWEVFKYYGRNSWELEFWIDCFLPRFTHRPLHLNVRLVSISWQSPAGVTGTDWAEFYDQYGNLVWHCREIYTGQFADNFRFAGLTYSDARWPDKWEHQLLPTLAHFQLLINLFNVNETRN